jgi:hypothetical protein
MKKLLFLLIITQSVFAQVKKDSVYVVTHIDEMDNTKYTYANRDLIVNNESITKGFIITPHISDEMRIEFTILVITAGFGGCSENDELIILFKDGENIIKKSWNKFNCQGESYFNFNEQEYKKLQTTEISKIRMTNGRDFESYTGTVKLKDQRYFIQLFKSLKL